jgi:hypothetical protein
MGKTNKRLEQFGVSLAGGTDYFDIIEATELLAGESAQISTVKTTMRSPGADMLVEVVESSDNGDEVPWSLVDDFVQINPGMEVIEGNDVLVHGPTFYKVRGKMVNPGRASVKLDGAASKEIITR